MATFLGGRAQDSCIGERDSYALYDPASDNFPIRHVSRGFEEMFGYARKPADGQFWRDLVGSQGILDCPAALKAAEAASGLSARKTASGLERLALMASEAVVATTQLGASQTIRAVQLCHKLGGELIVCEIAMRANTHPTLGWSYGVCVHKDITCDLSVSELLNAAQQESSLQNLLNSLQEQQLPSLASSESAKHLHRAAHKMWQSQMSNIFSPSSPSSPHSKGVKLLSSRSVVSKSTAVSDLSRESKRSNVTTGSSAISWTSFASKGFLARVPEAEHMELIPSLGAWSSSSQEEKVVTPKVHRSGGFHLGAVFERMEARSHFAKHEGDLSATRTKSQTSEELCTEMRFFDLLDCDCSADEMPATGNDQDQTANQPQIVMKSVSKVEDTPKLQQVIGQLCKKELCNLDFAMTIADPSQPGIPLVLSSAGFENLSGYSSQQVLGKSCRFLTEGVPDLLINAEASMQSRALCSAAAGAKYYVGDDGLHGLAMLGGSVQIPLPEGELVCMQTHARKSGELFRCLTYLKQVELEDDMYVVCLLARIADPAIDPEEHDTDITTESMEKRCQWVFRQLDEQMDVAIRVLASQFWYSAPMKRQTAGSDLESK